MKKGLWLGTILAILMMGYFHFFHKKRREKGIGYYENILKRNALLQKSNEAVLLEGSRGILSVSRDGVKLQMNREDFWLKNRRAIMEAINKERSDFDQLEEVSDSVATWRISKKYKGIRAKNFRKGTPFIARMGGYYIVEGNWGDVDMVFHKKTGEMGVLSGSIIVNVDPKSNTKELLEKWDRDEGVKVGSSFLHIGVVEIKTRPGENIAETAKRLERVGNVERVKIEVVRDNFRPW